jgi:hypothetical protein
LGGTNTLAYYPAKALIKIKSFITTTPGVNVLKRFSLRWKNKLVHLFKPSLIFAGEVKNKTVNLTRKH